MAEQDPGFYNGPPGDVVIVSSGPAVTDSFTAGVQAAPAIAFVMADTGALVAGVYKALIWLTGSAAAQFTISHRDAVNAADLANWPFDYELGAQGSGSYLLPEHTFALNERLRVIMGAIGPARCQAQILLQRVQ